MRLDSASALTVRNSVFLNNTAVSDGYLDGRGGAILVSGGTPQVEFHSSDFRLNTAANSGGGVHHDAGGSLLLDGIGMEDNWARYAGGGVYASGGIEQVHFL